MILCLSATSLCSSFKLKTIRFQKTSYFLVYLDNIKGTLGNMNSVDWNGRMERWSGLLEWSTGLDYWRGVAPLYARAMLLSVSACIVENLVGPRR